MDVISHVTRSAFEPSVVVLLDEVTHRMAAADRQRALRHADPTTLTRAELVEQLQVLEKERAKGAAREAALLVALAGRRQRERHVTVDGPDGEPERTITVVDESVDLMAAATQRAPGTVRRRLAMARSLHVRLPRTRARLEAGTISPEHAEVIARMSEGLPSTALPVYEARVLRSAAGRTPGQMAAVARRLRARLDRAGEMRRRSQARRHVDVQVWAEDDGLACVLARLPLADAARVEAAVAARSQCVTWLRDDATIGERRAAALVDAVCGGTAGTVSAEIQVTVDLATLVGLANAPAHVTVGGGEPEPITQGALRDLLASPDVPVSLRRLVVDPLSAHLLDRARTAYRVPEELRAFLVARDGTCRFPGCSRRARRCDIDHVLPWADGGPTSRANLMCLCRRHHVLKTHADWRPLRTQSDGTVVWRGPDGNEYTGRATLPVEPEDAPPGEADGAVVVDEAVAGETTGADPPF